MQVVKFKNGKFAIRRWCIFYLYLDRIQCTRDNAFWWSYTKDTQGGKVFFQYDTLEEAKAALLKYKNSCKFDKGEPV